jgi:hypothetical protein
MFDDIASLKAANYDADMLRCAVLFSKSLNMVETIGQIAPLNAAKYWQIIKYTESINIVEYILNNIFPSVKVPKFSIFKNKSIHIVKYLIKRFEWTDYDKIFLNTCSTDVTQYLYTNKLIDESYHVSDRNYTINYIKQNSHDIILDKNTTDIEFVMAVLNGVNLQSDAANLPWESIDLHQAKILFALGLNKYDALWNTSSHDIIEYLLDNYIVPSDQELATHYKSMCCQIIISRWILREDVDLDDAYADHEKGFLYYFHNNHSAICDILATTTSFNVAIFIIENIEDFLGGDNVLYYSPASVISYVIRNQNSREMIDYIIKVVSAHKKGPEWLQYTLDHVSDITTLEKLMAYKFLTIQNMLKNNSNIKVLRYIMDMYDIDDYNDALINTLEIEKIKFLIEECGATEYNNALVRTCLCTNISLDTVRYLVEAGADDYNTALRNVCSYSMCKNTNDEVVLYLINKGANNVQQCILNMYANQHPMILRESSTFRMLLYCSRPDVLTIKNQLILVSNGIGVLLNKNSELLEYAEAIPFIAYRKNLLKILKVIPLLPELLNVVASYIEYTILGSLTRNNKSRVIEVED